MTAIPFRMKNMGALIPATKARFINETRRFSPKERKYSPKTKSIGAAPAHTRSEVGRKRGRERQS
jgi:hypothetical protein